MSMVAARLVRPQTVPEAVQKAEENIASSQVL